MSAAGPSNGEDSYMEEYSSLKKKLLSTTGSSAGLFALYLFLTIDGEAALCSLLGSAFGVAYLLWLFRDVDNVKPTDKVPMQEAEDLSIPYLRGAAKVVAGYRQALQPRLLVPTALAVGIAVYNKLAPEPLELFYQGCLLAGFLTYKAGLVSKIFDDVTPKVKRCARAIVP